VKYRFEFKRLEILGGVFHTAKRFDPQWNSAEKQFRRARDSQGESRRWGAESGLQNAP
jgi:hypothetical protein